MVRTRLAAVRGRHRANLSDRRSRLAITGVIVLAAAAQFAAFYEALRRYAVGTTGPIFGFLKHPIWHPAIGIVGALGLGALGLVAISITYWLALRERSSNQSDELTGATTPN